MNRVFTVISAMLLSCLLWGCSTPVAETVPETVPVTTAVPEYTVTFQLNGGRLLSGETVQTVWNGQAAQPPEVRYGSRKLRWDTDFSNISADTTINALWEIQPLSAEALSDLARKVTIQLTVKPAQGQPKNGSGFFIDSDGTFATAFHLIDRAAEITVTTRDGTAHPLEKIVAFSPVYDIALLKIDLDTPDYLDICTEAPTEQEAVTIAGFEEADLTAASVTDGSYPIGLGSCLRLDTVIPTGAMGGPLLNSGGEAVGINCYQKIRSEKINLSVSAALLQELEEVNFTLEEMQQWHETETALSYRPSNDDRKFFDSLVHTFTEVTGRNCFASLTQDGRLQDGYLPDCIAYMHSYKAEELEVYTEYLLSQGFVLLNTTTLDGGQVQSTYINDVTNMTITCLLDEASGYLTVIPATI